MVYGRSCVRESSFVGRRAAAFVGPIAAALALAFAVLAAAPQAYAESLEALELDDGATVYIEAAEDGEMVAQSDEAYITKTGKKYHLYPDCTGLNAAKDVIPTTLAQAQASYDLCEICAQRSASAPAGAPAEWLRLYGNVALDTMYSIVERGIDNGLFFPGEVVILVTNNGYWDALTAAGLAGMYDAPIIMTNGDELSPQTAALLEDLHPSTLLICGGSAAVKDGTVSIAMEYVEDDFTVRRYWGANAIGTANNIFLQSTESPAVGWEKRAFVCTSNGYWDALAAAPISYARHIPIFLTDANGQITAETIAAMKAGGIEEVYITGGTAAIPLVTEQRLADEGFKVEERFAGATAVETSALVAEFGISHEGMHADAMGVATTNGYWDALSGAAVCGRNESVLVLVSDEKSSSISGFVAKHAADIASGYVFGGPAAVPDAALSALMAATR